AATAASIRAVLNLIVPVPRWRGEPESGWDGERRDRLNGYEDRVLRPESLPLYCLGDPLRRSCVSARRPARVPGEPPGRRTAMRGLGHTRKIRGAALCYLDVG